MLVAGSYSEINVLLVEDYEPDAILIKEKLRLRREVKHKLEWVTTMAEAEAWLSENHADIVLLDMNLSDSAGLRTVERTVELAEDAAVVVLTGVNERELALRSLEFGAQDFLSKDEINARGLQRVLVYALYRRRAQVRLFEQMLNNYKALADDKAMEDLPAIAGPLKEVNASLFEKALKLYDELLMEYLDSLVVRRRMPDTGVSPLIELLGEAGAGPKDVLDIHICALEDAVKRERPERAQYLNTDGRLLALKVMGALLSFYRRRAGGQTGG